MYHDALARDLGPDWAGRPHVMFPSLREAASRDSAREAVADRGHGMLDEPERERTVSRMSVAQELSALDVRAAGADRRGAYAEAAELIARIVRWAELRGSRGAFDARPYIIFSLLLIRLDRFAEAQRTLHRGRYAAQSLGTADALAVFHYQQALLHFGRGQLDDALAELDTRARLADDGPIGPNLPAESLSALIAIHRDNLIAAERHLAAAEREVAHGGSRHGVDLMTLARARLLEATGDTKAALEAMAAAVTATAAAGTVTFMPLLGLELARLAVAVGDPGRAAMAIPGLDLIARLNPGARSLQAYALHAHALIDGDADALLSAVELLRGSGRALEAARAAEDVAALIGADARELLDHARRTYQSHRARRDLNRVTAALRTLGARRGVPGARRRPEHGWPALTDTELNVIRLVAERLTNPEIAERLFISRRTVQTHVSHALAKLGVATRRELAAEAGRHAGWQLRIEGTG